MSKRKWQPESPRSKRSPLHTLSKDAVRRKPNGVNKNDMAKEKSCGKAMAADKKQDKKMMAKKKTPKKKTKRGM